MAGRWYALAAAVTLAVAACSERDPESTTGPQFAVGGPCDISNSVTNAYFPPSRQNFINNSLKASMANAGAGTNDARTFGFRIMDSIGSVSRNFSIDPAAGAQLTAALIGCMFNESATFTYPSAEGKIQAFTNALTRATGGAYYVRGGGGSSGADPDGRTLPILGRTSSLVDAGGNLSGVEPSSGTWTNMLAINGKIQNGPSGMNTDQGVLFYGYPIPNSPGVFEWTTLPSGVTLSPAGVFTVCDDPDHPSANLIVESGVGVLSFVNSSICSTQQQPLTFLNQGWGPKALAARLVRAFAGVMTPTPLQAAVLTGTKGGTSTAPRSRFNQELVTGLDVAWTEDPGSPSTWNGTSAATARPASASVSAEATSGDLAVRFCAYLSGTNNNGTLTKLVKVSGPQRNPECTTPPNGDPNALSVITTRVSNDQSKADFGLIYVTKTGTITFTLTVVSGAGLNKSLFSQANVKPALKK